MFSRILPSCLVATAATFVLLQLSTTIGVVVHAHPVSSDNNNNNSAAAAADGRPKRFLPDMMFGWRKDEESTMAYLYIGEVDLEMWPDCEDYLDPFLNRCQNDYLSKLYDTIERHNHRKVNTQKAVNDLLFHGDEEGEEGGGGKPPRRQKTLPKLKDLAYEQNQDYYKHASCCGMWKARKCVINAINTLPSAKAALCPYDLAERYRALPVEPKDKEHMLDYCSEFREGSAICAVSWSNGQRRVAPLGWTCLLTLVSLLFARASKYHLFLSSIVANLPPHRHHQCCNRSD